MFLNIFAHKCCVYFAFLIGVGGFFGQDWAYESPKNMGNLVNGRPQRVQTAPVHVSNC